MAELAGDNFLSVSQRFFSPDILQKISSEINQPIEQTKTGLKSVIPTLFMGIVNKGSTKEGAESLLNMANKEEMSPNITNNPEAVKERGDDVLKGIFGSNLNSIVSKLGDTTGMNTGSISKMLKMAAPMLLGMIGSKIRSDKMNTTALMNFLTQQKSSITGLLPAGMAGMSDFQDKIKGKYGWMKILLAIVLIAAAVYAISTIFFRSENVAILKTAPAPVAIATQAAPAESITMLETFIESDAAVGAVKRFRFEQLNFRTGSTALAAGSEFELNQIVAIMKANPAVTVKIEGFTDNVGSAQGNMNLSNQRALAVKNQLVSKGIKNSRIQAQGLGASNPVATNDTEASRAANRRIEFVVRR